MAVVTLHHLISTSVKLRKSATVVRGQSKETGPQTCDISKHRAVSTPHLTGLGPGLDRLPVRLGGGADLKETRFNGAVCGRVVSVSAQS